uniref:Obg domain-containing protein n=1 Tax=Angiostrongylus cantonensis TaxID=6313 RepID=A0A0K0D425_ANGCA
MPIGGKTELIAISNDEKRAGAQPYGKERWHGDLTFLVDERGGRELPKDFRQREYLARPEHTKRGGGRKFGAHKRGGARLFAPPEPQDDARVFTAEKRNDNAFSPILHQNGARGFTEEKKGGGRAFIYEKRGGARMFRGSKRDYTDEYPDWLIYEDTPLFEVSR